MKVGIAKSKDDPTRLVLQVEEYTDDVTDVIVQLLQRSQTIEDPEPVGVNAVAFSIPEELDEEHVREIKISLINLTRTTLSDSNLVRQLQQERGQLVVITRDNFQQIVDEIAQLRLTLARAEVQRDAYIALYEDTAKVGRYFSKLCLFLLVPTVMVSATIGVIAMVKLLTGG